MKQFNILATTKFLKQIRFLIKHRGYRTKAEAFRMVVSEAAQQVMAENKKVDFRGLLGIGLHKPLNPTPRFNSNDELW